MSLTSQRGFSLLQGIFVLAVLTITSLSTAPLYYRSLADRHVVAYTNELVGTLHQGRLLAVRNMSPVSLCSSSNGRDCTQTPWAQGYIAFADSGRPGVVDGEDRIFHTVASRTTPVRVVLSGADHIRFLGNGAVLADASSSDPRPATVRPEQPAALSGLLDAFSPLSAAHAADDTAVAAEQPVAFLVCSGKVGRAIRVTAIGRLDTSAVACR